MAAEARMLKNIEEYVDQFGIDGVLDALADVCELKGQHIRENWQDENHAKMWERWGRAIRRNKGKLEE